MKNNRSSNYAGSICAMLIVAVVSCLFLFTGCSEKKVIYTNHTFGFSVAMSEEFAAATKIREEGNVIFFEAENLKWGTPDEYIPIIGIIEIYDKDEYTAKQMQEKYEMYNLRIIAESQQYYLGAAHATDAQMMPDSSPEDLQKFRNFEAVFDQLMNTLEMK